ncbi:MAG: sensor domain-containing diguanylate cyclase [Cyanobacteria bacterium P01_G01_bin.54]
MKKLKLLKIPPILSSVYKKKLLFDGAISAAIIIVVYSIAATFDINEKWIEWSEKYEQWEIDELPFGLSVFAFAMVWFAWRRLQDLKKINRALSLAQQSLLSEIAQRKQAEKLEAETRHKIEKNMRIQQLRNARDSVIQEMGEFLMFAHSKTEIINIAVQRTQEVLPFESGAIYEYQGDTLKYLQGWGDFRQDISSNLEDYTCWASRRFQAHIETFLEDTSPLCAHAMPGFQSICVPILTPKGMWGIFYFCRSAQTDEDQQELDIGIQEINRLAKSITDALGLHLHNLFLKEQLTLESMKDPLTGILNRRGLKQMVHERNLLGNPELNFAVLLFDIDHFKSFNDRYGHDMGDRAIISVVEAVNNMMRSEDIFCRHGGEEFVLIFSDICSENVIRRAEGIRRLVEDKTIEIGQEKSKKLTISIGIAIYPEHGNTYEQLFEHADKALYFAKQHGRNQVVDYEQFLQSS